MSEVLAVEVAANVVAIIAGISAGMGAGGWEQRVRHKILTNDRQCDIIDDNQNIVLKTVFPSRKYHKIYGGKK